MGLNHIDIAAALRRLAERRIEDAMREGKFDNLEGHGKPLDLEPMPANEDARLAWWAVRILKQNDVVPDEVKWRKAIDHLKERLHQLTDESLLPALVSQINALIHKVNTLGTNVLLGDLAPVDLGVEQDRLRARLAFAT